MQYLADTNIYRNLVKNLTIEEVEKLAELIRLKQNEKDYKAGFPVVVAMELISHLVKGDPNYNECYNSLCILFHHTKTFNSTIKSYSGIQYPPLDVILVKHFFNQDTYHLEVYSKVINLTVKLTEVFNINDIEKYQEDINIVKEQVQFNKTEIHKNYSDFVKSLSENGTDWEYFAKNKQKRKEWIKDIRSGKSTFFVAEGFMKRAFHLMKLEYERSDENLIKLHNFLKGYLPALSMNELLLDQLGHGTRSLSNAENKKWNTIHDISIMFGMLYNSDIDNKVLVTEDQNMQQCLRKYGMSHRVLGLVEFKKKLGI
ncbi:MAG: hypothetical protein GY834_01270 [Bacteroidetes bacterium]|nr:hypothetical protein [Bacteroidota bacterium]